MKDGLTDIFVKQLRSMQFARQTGCCPECGTILKVCVDDQGDVELSCANCNYQGGYSQGFFD